jgi:YHS domain-containing protein
MGLIRLLVLGALGYVGYRVIKGVFGSSKRLDHSMNGGVIDEMVQDPQCKTYIPRREAQTRVINGQRYFFCGNACADKFEKEMKQ